MDFKTINGNILKVIINLASLSIYLKKFARLEFKSALTGEK